MRFHFEALLRHNYRFGRMSGVHRRLPEKGCCPHSLPQ